MGNSRINRAAGETEQVVRRNHQPLFGSSPTSWKYPFVALALFPWRTRWNAPVILASFSHLEFEGFLPGLLRWWWYSAVITWCLTQRPLPGAAAAPHFMHFPSLARRSCHLRWRDSSKSVNSSTMRLTPSPPDRLARSARVKSNACSRKNSGV